MIRKLIPDTVRDQKLLKMPRTATVREAAQRMVRRNVRSVLITNRDRLEGIFTGTDLIGVVARGLDPERTTLAEVMTPNPETIPAKAHAIEALRRMRDARFRHLPIIEGDKLVGIVSRRDFLGYEVDEIERQEAITERI